jgi:type IV pilus assembly protein PilF
MSDWAGDSMGNVRVFVGVVAAAALLAGCAGSPEAGEGMAMETAASSATDAGAIIGEVSPPRERARVHTELAAAYYERGNMGVALEELRIALSADPSYAQAYNILGLVHMDLKESPQAQQSFERGLRIAPNDADINHNYGWFLCQSNREELSLRYFLAAIKNPLYSTPQKSYALAGSCALRAGKQGEARDYFERALRLDPNLPVVLLNLGRIKYQAGEFSDARGLVGRYNQLVEPTAESLWLAVRIERRLGDRAAEAKQSAELRRRFPGSKEHEQLVRGQFE